MKKDVTDAANEPPAPSASTGTPEPPTRSLEVGELKPDVVEERPWEAPIGAIRLGLMGLAVWMILVGAVAGFWGAVTDKPLAVGFALFESGYGVLVLSVIVIFYFPVGQFPDGFTDLARTLFGFARRNKQ